jgi:hypothetical protein
VVLEDRIRAIMERARDEDRDELIRYGRADNGDGPVGAAAAPRRRGFGMFNLDGGAIDFGKLFKLPGLQSTAGKEKAPLGAGLKSGSTNKRALAVSAFKSAVERFRGTDLQSAHT